MKEKWSRIKWEVVITFIISLTSVFVAMKANNISKLQAEIARNSALPMIEVEEKIEESNGVGWEESSVIEISNRSGKMKKYHAEVVTFLSCGYFVNESVEYELVDIPIENYYLLNVKEGTTIGVIEKKDSVGNYAQVNELKKEILQFNSENPKGQSVDARVQSYLKVSYFDLLNEKQELYYLLDTLAVEVIDSDLGKMYFQKYKNLSENGFSINFNRLDEVTVKEVIDTIEEILNFDNADFADQNSDILEENKMSILNEPIVTTIIGAIIGFVSSVLGGWIVYRQEKRNQESVASSILYNDLKSIEEYLVDERSSVNLKYSDEWQHMVANCSFLNDKDIKWIYEIYNEVYNYNYHYKCREQIEKAFRKEDICSYKKLQNRMFDISRGYPDIKKYSKEYELVMNSLQEHRK